MNNNNTYCQRNKKMLLDQALNCYDQEVGKERAKEYYENNKEIIQETTQ